MRIRLFSNAPPVPCKEKANIESVVIRGRQEALELLVSHIHRFFSAQDFAGSVHAVAEAGRGDQSLVGEMVIFKNEFREGRITIIFVKEPLGF